jgi:hypothetical protein
MAKRKGNTPPGDENRDDSQGQPEPDKAPEGEPTGLPAPEIPPGAGHPDAPTPADPGPIPGPGPVDPPAAPAQADAPAEPAEPRPEELKTAVVTLHEQNLALQAALKEAQRLLAVRRRNDDKLAQSARRMRRLREEAETKKKASDAAKKAAEQAEAEHLELEEELRTGQQQLPFDEPDEGPSREEAGLDAPGLSPVKQIIKAKMDEVALRKANEREADELPPEGETAHDLADPKAVPVEVLGEHGLAAKYVKVLKKREFHTIGDIARWTAPPPEGKGKRLRDIAGIRDKGQDEMINALDSFWAAAKARAAQAQADAPPPAEGEAPADNSWEAVPIEALDIAIGVVDILKRFTFDPPLDTMGGLIGFVSMGNELASIQGMTPIRCQSLNKAIIKLFTEREAAGLPVPPPPDDAQAQAPPEGGPPADPPAEPPADDAAA